ncbi:MAG: DUF6585 family protein, partial [Acidobacteriota bacterium]
MRDSILGKMQALTLPPSFAPVHGLGKPLRVHDLGNLNRWTRVVFSLAGMALALAIFLYGLVLYSRQFPPPPRQYLAVPFIFAILLFLGALLWFWRIRMRWDEAVVLFSDGLAYYDGRKILDFRWEDIAAIFTRGKGDVPGGFLHREGTRAYTVVHQDGTMLKLGDDLQQVEELYEGIRRRVYHPILTRCCTEYDSGEIVQFGPFGLSQSLGLITANKSFLWDEIGQVTIQQGRLHLKP